ncbi:MAG: STELLO glycosyltransferase family protein [Cyanobacteria bacterium P01_D01_bin.156]
MVKSITSVSNSVSSLETNQFIVLTSINSPTNAVKKISEIYNHHLIVIGDKKTPDPWALKNVSFLSVHEQQELGFNLTKKLPFNHYARKNLGYLSAIKYGAELIIDTDDDNFPKENWGIPDFCGNYLTTSKNLGFINVYKSFTDMHIWPRGFPLDLIQSATSILKPSDLDKCLVNIGIWQGLADGDPDVDAIYRLVDNTPCFFQEREPIVLGKGTISPFNSQNTAFQKQLFPLLYLPSFVNFRFTDILRGLIAQPIMWLYDYQLGFTKATVIQERNPHDYIKDFESEIPCYLNSCRVIDIVTKSISSSLSIPSNLYQAYEALLQANIVTRKEISLLSLWLKDLSELGFS